MHRTLISTFTAAILLLSATGPADSAADPAAPGSPRTFEIDSARSRIEVFVGRAGLFKGLGHDHLVAAGEISGRVSLEPERLAGSSVDLRVTAGSLQVLDPKESPVDRAKVQETMRGPEVLDAARFPEIRFASTRVTPEAGAETGRKLDLAGTLSLHGVEKEIRFPVLVRVNGTELTAEGDAFILQTDFAITPIRVGGGLVKVEDRLRIHFAIQAREKPA